MSALFGHEGSTSILSVLKKRGWSSKLSAGNKFEARGIELFDIDVDLTENGVDHVDDIIKLIFQVRFNIYFIISNKILFAYLCILHDIVCEYVKT